MQGRITLYEEVWRCQSNPIWLKISFAKEIVDKFDKFGTVFQIRFFNKSIVIPENVCKIARCVANSVDPDQTPRSAVSDLGLHCLLRSVCPNT